MKNKTDSLIQPMEYAKQNREYAVKLRRFFHSFPELAFREFQTSERIVAELGRLGVRCQKVCETGVLAVVGEGGPVVGIRADMDGLPIGEKSDAPYASGNPGVMHACGHDGHIAVLLTVAKYLSEHGGGLQKTVKLIFQPAEEPVTGAKALLDANPAFFADMDMIFGFHLWNLLPTGVISVEAGPRMAACDYFTVRIIGKSCHASTPHLGTDALYVGARVVTALQGIVPRLVSPNSGAVLSVCKFHAGAANNVLAGEAELEGTVRAFSEDTRALIKRGVRSVSSGVAGSFGALMELAYTDGPPPLVNDGVVSALAEKRAALALGEKAVVTMERTAGAEDFADYLQKTPGCYAFVGTGREGCFPHHNERFDIDEDGLVNAAAYLISVIQA